MTFKSNLRQATDVDRVVGENIRQRRRELKISQNDLGEAVGISFKQIRKYEQGKNRVGAGMLFRIARALDAEVQDFFDDLSGYGEADSEITEEAEFLAREYLRIRSPVRRKAFMNLLRAVADRECAPHDVSESF